MAVVNVHRWIDARHVNHAVLYLDNVYAMLNKLVSDEFSPKLLRLFTKEEGTTKVSMYDGIVTISEMALYNKTKYDPSMDERNLDLVGLYMRIEQHKPDRRSVYDKAYAEIFVFDKEFYYFVTSADENRYNIDNLDPKNPNKVLYDECCIRMGLKLPPKEETNYFTKDKEPKPLAYKIDLKPYIEEFAIQYKNLPGIFKIGQKGALTDILRNKYRVYSDKYKEYIKKINFVANLPELKAEYSEEKQKKLIK